MRIRLFPRLAPVILALSVTACESVTGVAEIFDHHLVGIAVDQGSIVEVGDTVRVSAMGDVDGLLGIFSYDPVLDARWTISDPTIARLEPLPPPPPEDSFPRAKTLIRGLRPGTTSVRATARGVSGQAAVRVIPVLATIRMQVASDTISVGDTVSVTAVAVDGAGAAIGGLPVTFTVEGALQLNGWHDNTARIVATAVGAGKVEARFRRAAGEARLVVVPSGT